MRWPRCARRILFTLDHSVSKGRARVRSPRFERAANLLDSARGTLRIRGTRSSQPTGSPRPISDMRCVSDVMSAHGCVDNPRGARDRAVHVVAPNPCHAPARRALRVVRRMAGVGRHRHRPRSFGRARVLGDPARQAHALAASVTRAEDCGVPHLHWHLIPRYTTDSHPGGPVWEDLNFLRQFWLGGAPPDEKTDASRRSILVELRRSAIEIEREYVAL